jgi:hypothetical protein
MPPVPLADGTHWPRLAYTGRAWHTLALLAALLLSDSPWHPAGPLFFSLNKQKVLEPLILQAHPAGFEPATRGLEIRCSIH